MDPISISAIIVSSISAIGTIIIGIIQILQSNAELKLSCFNSECCLDENDEHTSIRVD